MISICTSGWFSKAFAARHTRFSQNRRIDEEDVSHRQEGRYACGEFGADVGFVFGELEEGIESLNEERIRHDLLLWSWSFRQLCPPLL